MFGFYWFPVMRTDPRVVDIFQRHYSARQWRGRAKWLRYGFAGPSKTLTLLGADNLALFVWRETKYRRDGQTGVECSVFRNEGQRLSSELIEEACVLAWTRWPNARLYTFVDGRKIKSTNPGYCFKQAGFKTAGISVAKQLTILERVDHVLIPQTS